MFLFVNSSKKDDSGHPIGYIVYFARTPVEVKETTEDDEDGDDLEVVIKNIQEVDPEWMMEHAKQGKTCSRRSLELILAIAWWLTFDEKALPSYTGCASENGTIV